MELMDNNEKYFETITKKVEKQYPFEYTLSIINGKWKIRILYLLSINDVMRNGELKLELKSITHKMLAKQLKEMEADGLINRIEYMQIPPKVEYSLTETGKTLIPLINAICHWGEEHRPIKDGEVIIHKWHIE